MNKVLNEAEHLQLIALLTCARQKAMEAEQFERAIKRLIGDETDGVGDLDHLSDFIWSPDHLQTPMDAIRKAGFTVE